MGGRSLRTGSLKFWPVARLKYFENVCSAVPTTAAAWPASWRRNHSQQGLDLGHLRNDGSSLVHPFSVELDKGVPALEDFAGLQVADPVVRESG